VADIPKWTAWNDQTLAYLQANRQIFQDVAATLQSMFPDSSISGIAIAGAMAKENHPINSINSGDTILNSLLWPKVEYGVPRIRNSGYQPAARNSPHPISLVFGHGF